MILCSGAFDGVHAGHIQYLEAAARVSPFHKVIVAVAPDSYIRTAKQREPYWCQADRALTVGALKIVNGVVCHGTDSIAPLIDVLKPSYLVKGKDWEGCLPTDVVWACQHVQCAMVFVDTPGRHVSEAHG